MLKVRDMLATSDHHKPCCTLYDGLVTNKDNILIAYHYTICVSNSMMLKIMLHTYYSTLYTILHTLHIILN